MNYSEIEKEASNLFLFDARSQHRLQEALGSIKRNSRDWFLVRFSQAAILYYNELETSGWDTMRSLQQSSNLLKDAMHYREDRLFYVLAVRMELDQLLHMSRLRYNDGKNTHEKYDVYSNFDSIAEKKCRILLSNLPAPSAKLPHSWYTPSLPLYPPYQVHILDFIRSQSEDQKIEVLSKIISAARKELIAILGILGAKKTLASAIGSTVPRNKILSIMFTRVKTSIAKFEVSKPQHHHLVKGVTTPKNMTVSAIKDSRSRLGTQLELASIKKNIPDFLSFSLQMGIISFLDNSYNEAIHHLANVMEGFKVLDDEHRQLRQFNFNSFPDIPFMIGTSYLRASLRKKGKNSEYAEYSRQQAQTALIRAIEINNNYHDAFINLAMALDDRSYRENIMRCYLEVFDYNITALDHKFFLNLACSEAAVSDQESQSQAMRWVLLAELGSKNELTAGKKMLQELKTLYNLSSYKDATKYIDSYSHAVRSGNEEFIKDISENTLHSAILFYLAHALTYSGIKKRSNASELDVNFSSIIRAIKFLNEALFFNSHNESALRLVDSIYSIISFGLRNNEKLWASSHSRMGQLGTYYEENLYINHCIDKLQELLKKIDKENDYPPLKMSPAARSQIDHFVPPEKRVSIQRSVHASISATEKGN